MSVKVSFLPLILVIFLAISVFPAGNSVAATLVINELMANNTGSVRDQNGDDEVNILDIALVASVYETRLGDLGWNPIADLNNDAVINILDIALVAKAYGQKAQADARPSPSNRH